eukprot:1061696-Amphidinium_carterae.1
MNPFYIGSRKSGFQEESALPTLAELEIIQTRAFDSWAAWAGEAAEAREQASPSTKRQRFQWAQTGKQLQHANKKHYLFNIILKKEFLT